MDSDWMFVYMFVCLLAISASLAAHDGCDGRKLDLEAQEETRYISSPNYPSNYSANVSCRWRLYGDYHESDVIIHIVDLDIESSRDCVNDRLAIWGYRFADSYVVICGSLSPNKTIDISGTAEIAFETNGNVSGRGFRIEYRSQYKDNDHDRDYEDHHYVQKWGIVVLCIVVVMAIGAAVAIGVGCYIKRRQRARGKLENPTDLKTVSESVEASAPQREEKYDLNYGIATEASVPPREEKYDLSYGNANVQYLGSTDNA